MRRGAGPRGRPRAARCAALVLLATSGLAIGAACRRPETVDGSRGLTIVSGQAMGTTWTVRLAGTLPSRVSRETLEGTIASAIAEIEDLMTTYRESEVTRFNAWRGQGSFALSEPTRETVALALELAVRTEGALDVTVGPLVAAYGFGAAAENAPSPQRLNEARALVGFDLLTLDEVGLHKGHPEVEIDLSAVAKGFSVDRVAEALDVLGLADYMVEVGGEVRSRGQNERDQTWRIGVERPDAARRTIQRVVELGDRALATSGDYRQYREVDGRRISHILDPRTGRPIEHRVASATVLHPSCARADGLATAMMVLGESGLRLAEEEGWAVLLLLRTADGFEERASSAFDRLTSRAGEGGAARGAATIQPTVGERSAG